MEMSSKQPMGPRDLQDYGVENTPDHPAIVGRSSSASTDHHLQRKQMTSPARPDMEQPLRPERHFLDIVLRLPYRQPDFQEMEVPDHRIVNHPTHARKRLRSYLPPQLRMISLSVSGLLKAAGTYPLFQAAAIIFGTFILEDAATVLAATQVEAGNIHPAVALGALYAGIVLGDLGLYGTGRMAAQWPRINRLVSAERHAHGRRWLSTRVFRVVFVSRFIPGARLPTYTACGFLGANFPRFTLAAVFATSIWTSLLFLISLRVGHLLMEHFGAWRWAGAIGFAIAIVVIGRVVAHFQDEAA
jgi:membrane protein DedA with SNARE-associated domain